MRTIFLLASLLTLLFAGPTLQAQDAGSSDQGQKKMLSFLSESDQKRYIAARIKAMADNPDLKAEQDAMAKQRPGPDASAEDRRAFFGKMVAHHKKMREAMLKEDPTIGPVLDQVDKHMMDMMKQKAAGN